MLKVTIGFEIPVVTGTMYDKKNTPKIFSQETLFDNSINAVILTVSLSPIFHFIT